MAGIISHLFNMLFIDICIIAPKNCRPPNIAYKMSLCLLTPKNQATPFLCPPYRPNLQETCTNCMNERLSFTFPLDFNSQKILASPFLHEFSPLPITTRNSTALGNWA